MSLVGFVALMAPRKVTTPFTIPTAGGYVDVLKFCQPLMRTRFVQPPVSALCVVSTVSGVSIVSAHPLDTSSVVVTSAVVVACARVPRTYAVGSMMVLAFRQEADLALR